MLLQGAQTFTFHTPLRCSASQPPAFLLLQAPSGNRSCLRVMGLWVCTALLSWLPPQGFHCPIMRSIHSPPHRQSPPAPYLPLHTPCLMFTHLAFLDMDHFWSLWRLLHWHFVSCFQLLATRNMGSESPARDPNLHPLPWKERSNRWPARKPYRIIVFIFFIRFV